MQSVYMRLDIGPGIFQCSLDTWDQLAPTLSMRKPTSLRALAPTPPNFRGVVFTLAFLVFFLYVLINVNQENTILRERERERALFFYITLLYLCLVSYFCS